MARSVDPVRCAVWRERFRRFQQAGVSVASFCARERVSVPSFYQWRKKLAIRKDHEPPRTKPAPPTFAQVRLVGAASLNALLPGGTRLQIPLGDPRTPELLEWLRQVDAEQAARADHPGGEAC